MENWILGQLGAGPGRAGIHCESGPDGTVAGLIKTECKIMLNNESMVRALTIDYKIILIEISDHFKKKFII